MPRLGYVSIARVSVVAARPVFVPVASEMPPRVLSTIELPCTPTCCAADVTLTPKPKLDSIELARPLSFPLTMLVPMTVPTVFEPMTVTPSPTDPLIVFPAITLLRVVAAATFVVESAIRIPRPFSTIRLP